jgi:WD40 repeat protein
MERAATVRQWDVALGKPVGPTWPLGTDVWAVRFGPDGKRVVVSSGPKDSTARTVRVWDVPAPVEGTAERINLWVQVLTGMELDAGGAARLLDEYAWRYRRERLRALGGPP